MSQLAPSPRYPSAKFESVGQSYTGVVAEPPEDRHARKFQSTELDYWPDGRPVIQTRIVLDPGNGGERFAIYAKGRMATAIRQALIAASAGDIEVGGRLTITFDHVEPSKGGGQPSKHYTASYTAPTAAPPGATSDPWASDPWPDEPPF